MLSPNRNARALALLQGTPSAPEDPGAVREAISTLEKQLGLPAHARRPEGFSASVLEGAEALLRVQGCVTNVDLRLSAEAALALVLGRNAKMLGDRLVLFLLRRVRGSEASATQAFSLRVLAVHLCQLQASAMKGLITVSLEPCLLEVSESCTSTAVASAVLAVVQSVGSSVLCVYLSVESLRSLQAKFLSLATRCGQPEPIRRIWALTASTLLRQCWSLLGWSVYGEKETTDEPRAELGLVSQLLESGEIQGCPLEGMIQMALQHLMEAPLQALQALEAVVKRASELAEPLEHLKVVTRGLLARSSTGMQQSLAVPLLSCELSCWAALLIADAATVLSEIDRDINVASTRLWTRCMQHISELSDHREDPLIIAGLVALATELKCNLAASQCSSSELSLELESVLEDAICGSVASVTAQGCVSLGECAVKIRSREMRPWLLRMFQLVETHACRHAYWLVRVKAIKSLACWPLEDQKAVRRVTELALDGLGDPNQHVREAAAALLGCLAGKGIELGDLLLGIIDRSVHVPEQASLALGIAEAFACVLKAVKVEEVLFVEDIVVCTVFPMLHSTQATDTQLHMRVLQVVKALHRAPCALTNSWELCFGYSFKLARLLARAACGLLAEADDDQPDDPSSLPTDSWWPQLHARVSALHWSDLGSLKPEIFSELRTATLEALSATLAARPAESRSVPRLRSVLGVHFAEAPVLAASVLADWMVALRVQGSMQVAVDQGSIEQLAPLIRVLEESYLTTSSSPLHTQVLRLCAALPAAHEVQGSTAAAALERLRDTVVMCRQPELFGQTLAMLSALLLHGGPSSQQAIKLAGGSTFLLEQAKQVLGGDGADQIRLLGATEQALSSWSSEFWQQIQNLQPGASSFAGTPPEGEILDGVDREQPSMLDDRGLFAAMSQVFQVIEEPATMSTVRQAVALSRDSAVAACVWSELLPWLEASLARLQEEYPGELQVVSEMVQALCEGIILQRKGYKQQPAESGCAMQQHQMRVKRSRGSRTAHVGAMCAALAEHSAILGECCGQTSWPRVSLFAHKHSVTQILEESGKEALAAVNTAAQDAHELVNALTGLVLHCVKHLRLPDEWGDFSKGSELLWILVEPNETQDQSPLAFPEEVVKAVVCAQVETLMSLLLTSDTMEEFGEMLSDPAPAPAVLWPAHGFGESRIRISDSLDEHAALHLLERISRRLQGCWFAGLFRHLWAMLTQMYTREENPLPAAAQKTVLQILVEILEWREASHSVVDTALEDGLASELLRVCHSTKQPAQLRSGAIQILAESRLVELVSPQQLSSLATKLRPDWSRWESDPFSVSMQVLALCKTASVLQQPGATEQATLSLGELLSPARTTRLGQSVAVKAIGLLIANVERPSSLTPLLAIVDVVATIRPSNGHLRTQAAMVQVGLQMIQQLSREAEEGGRVLSIIKVAAELCEHPKLPLSSFAAIFDVLRQLLLSFSVSHLHRQRIITTALPWAAQDANLVHRCESLKLLMAALVTGEEKDTSLKLVQQLVTRVGFTVWPSRETVLLASELPGLCIEATSPADLLSMCIAELSRCPSPNVLVGVAAHCCLLQAQVPQQQLLATLHQSMSTQRWGKAAEGDLIARCDVLWCLVCILSLAQPSVSPFHAQALKVSELVLTPGLALFQSGSDIDRERAMQLLAQVDVDVFKMLVQAQRLKELK